MKTAIYVESGITQLVFTPETTFETEVVNRIVREHDLDVFDKTVWETSDKIGTVHLLYGEFYHCQGGYVKQGAGADSLIIRLDSPAKGD